MRIITFLSVSIVLISAIVSAQDKGVVLDEATSKPIPYVNIRSGITEKAISSDGDGNFFIDFSPEDLLTFSAVGYEILKIPASQSDRVTLQPIVYPLDGITITKPKRTIEATIGGYRKNKIDLFYGSAVQSYIYARFFKPEPKFAKTPFLKKLKILTRSDVKDAKFNVHIYRVNPDGTPGEEMGMTNIIAVAKKGKQDTTVDLSEFSFRIPENGVFIGVETLIIPENRYVRHIYNKEDKTTHESHSYSPIFGTTRTDANTSWGFGASHKWGEFKQVSQEQIQKYHEDFKKATGKEAPPFDNRYNEFAMQLILTN